jgi:REP element-mobilizing transposase RayT
MATAARISHAFHKNKTGRNMATYRSQKSNKLVKKAASESAQNQASQAQKQFGGPLLKNSNAKEQRPISTKTAMHVVLRSSLAKGNRSMLNPGKSIAIKKLVHDHADNFNIKIHEFTNTGNQLHMLIKVGNRNSYLRFIRTVTGLIARVALGVERGKKMGVKFWDMRPYTRVVDYRPGYKFAKDPVVRTQLMSLGLTPKKGKAKTLKFA